MHSYEAAGAVANSGEMRQWGGSHAQTELSTRRVGSGGGEPGGFGEAVSRFRASGALATRRNSAVRRPGEGGAGAHRTVPKVPARSALVPTGRGHGGAPRPVTSPRRPSPVALRVCLTRSPMHPEPRLPHWPLVVTAQSEGPARAPAENLF